MKTLFFLTIFAAAASATNLLLPLYVWPDIGAWDNVYKAIEANNQLAFQIIINPDSGPGSSAPGDSDEYAAGVTKLNSYPNVQLFGYVHCNYDTSSGDAINHNVTRWNAWNADLKTSIDGIFYDEIPNEEGNSESVAFLASLVNAAKSIFGDHPFKSIFNPGAKPEYIELYDSADYIVVFESEASSYNDAVLANQIPSGKASQSSILIHSFAGQGNEAQLRTWLQGMISAGVASAHVLNTGYDEANDDGRPAGIGTVASILSFSGGQSAAKPADGTGFATSRRMSGGSSSTPKSVVNMASMSAPEIISSSEPCYSPYDGDREDNEDYEEDGDIQGDDDIPKDVGLQEDRQVQDDGEADDGRSYGA